MAKLGVNVDHVATIRQARKTFEPDPVAAAQECEKAGADSIVCHLRMDRRHINDKDLERLRKVVTTKLNLEMSIEPEICDIACKTRPHQATLVPENRQEITTEGGLDVVQHFKRIKETVHKLTSEKIEASLFIDPAMEQVKASLDLGVKMIEFHTGKYAEAFNSNGDYKFELSTLQKMVDLARGKGLTVCLGHGLTYQNVIHPSRIQGVYEFNIGHSIIARAVFIGIKEAVREMKRLIS